MTHPNSTSEFSNETKSRSASFHRLMPWLIYFLTFFAVIHFWGQEWSILSRILIAVGLYLAIAKLYKVLFLPAKLRQKSKQQEQQERHPAYDWPTPGPFNGTGLKGKMLPLIIFYGSSMLTILNPFILVQHVRILLGQMKTFRRLDSEGINEEQDFKDYKTKVSYRLPFDGEWLVYNGGPTPETSHSWELLTQRYAYDFVKADAGFKRHSSSGTKLTDYFCYEQPILAAADGEVIKVVNNISDGPLIGFWVMDFLTRNLAGSHVIIKHAESEYGFYAHLIKGSIPLKQGDKVKKGQTIGLCGHSGNSSEPHLHFHLQDQASFYSSLGLPVKFESSRIDNEFIETDAVLKRGNRVEYTG
ncbi:MAG: M23 family metallopeptidase [Gammaproteobacteria bacterium]|nr:M23 family metallopeptidase [Gammaproteobacteria bacterium]